MRRAILPRAPSRETVERCQVSVIAQTRSRPQPTLSLLVALLGVVDQSLHVLRHLVHSVLPPRGLPLTAPSSLTAILRTSRTHRSSCQLSTRQQHPRRSTSGHRSLLARGLDRGHDVEVEIVRVRVIGDELRDLNASDEVLVRVGHEIIVLGLQKSAEMISFSQARRA